MKQMRLLLFALAVSTSSADALAQKLVSCPNPKPVDVQCILTGEAFEVDATQNYAAGFNTLYMEDNSVIIVRGVSSWRLVVGTAHIGADTQILLMGRDGNRGADGKDYDQQNEKPGYADPGKSGRGGATGEAGASNPALSLQILRLQKIGDLEIKLYPGRGGDGGNGGRGQPGGDANCRYRGGDGGPGGLPGSGGDGGRFGPVTVTAGLVTGAMPLTTAPPKICETAICLQDPQTGSPYLKALFDPVFPVAVFPPEKKHGIWFSCLNEPCTDEQQYENWGEGGRGGIWSEGGAGRSGCVGFYGVGGGERGADNSHLRGPHGRGSTGPKPQLFVHTAK